MSNVIIGKKELFSFAERYAGCRVREYSALVDGEVVALLFSKVFPLYRIQPASHHTHSLSQRLQQNWESIYRLCARLAIPLALLHPTTLGTNREHGFSTLALIYFLYHLSKKPDFSAEFSEDVPDALIEYLQSLDSIATLFLGEALEWSAVPEEVGEHIRGLPVFHTSAAEEKAAEEAAAKQFRLLLSASSPASARRRDPVAAPPATVALHRNTANGDTRRREPSAHATTSSKPPSAAQPLAEQVPHRTGSTGTPSPSPPFSASPALQHKVFALDRMESTIPAPSAPTPTPSDPGVGGAAAAAFSSSSASSRPRPPTSSDGVLLATATTTTTSPSAAELHAALERERLLLHQLAVKTEECERLHCKEMELLDQLSRSSSVSAFAHSPGFKAAEVAGVNATPSPSSLNCDHDRSAEMYRFLYEMERDRTAALEERLREVAPRLTPPATTTTAAAPVNPSTSVSSEKPEWRPGKGIAMKEDEVDELLSDIRDPETDVVIEAHHVANQLHESILGSVRDAKQREGGIQLLRLLWSAYSELEKRLVRAVELLEHGTPQPSASATPLATAAEEKVKNEATPTTSSAGPSPRSVAPEDAGEMKSSVLQSKALDPPLRTEAEHPSRSRRAIADAVASLQSAVDGCERMARSMYTVTCRREEQWRSLCAKLYQVEKLTAGITERVEIGSVTTEELHTAVQSRESYYQEIERLTEELLQRSSKESEPNNSPALSSNSHDIMKNIETQLEALKTMIVQLLQ